METSRVEMFRRLLEKDPDNAMILFSLGTELFKGGRYQEARELLARAVESKPDYSVAYRMLGRANYELREDAEARRVFARGREVAKANGDLQTVREIDVYLRRIERREAGEG